LRHGALTQFLDVVKALDAWVVDRPLNYELNRAHDVHDILGTWLLGSVNGHWRYRHITALRDDSVNPQRCAGVAWPVRTPYAAPCAGWIPRPPPVDQWHLLNTMEPLPGGDGVNRAAARSNEQRNASEDKSPVHAVVCRRQRLGGWPWARANQRLK
jgi:hypothetical protein